MKWICGEPLTPTLQNSQPPKEVEKRENIISKYLKVFAELGALVKYE